MSESVSVAPSVAVTPGRFNLTELQQTVASRQIHLVEPSLEPFRSPLDIQRLGIERLTGNKRLEGVRQAQSNEPFRPFMELLLNSIDYSTSSHPHLTILVSQLENGGWQVVIQDKPQGTGMNSETLLNTYLDPHASGSAETRQTPQGEWKKGFMGVGAQQQVSLLRHDGDEIYISATPKRVIEGEQAQTTVAKLQYGDEDIILTLGGITKTDSREGVSQIIRLTGETCRELNFTPENLAAYFTERLAIVDGVSLDMVVTQALDRQEQYGFSGLDKGFMRALDQAWKTLQASKRETTTLPRQETDELFQAKLKAHLEMAGRGENPPQDIFADASTTRKRITYELVRHSLDQQRISGYSSGTNIIYSTERSNEALVYVNVLGVRVGDPIAVKGSNLPRTVDLRFDRPIETITEGRRSTGLTETDLHDLLGSVDQISYAHLSEDTAENIRIQLSLLSALSPLYEKYESQNRWRNRYGMSLDEKLRYAFSEKLERCGELDIAVLPSSFSGVLTPKEGVVYVPDKYVKQDLQASLIEQAGLSRIPQLSPSSFFAELSIDDPVWVSKEGILIVNSRRISTLDEQGLVKVLALIDNRQRWNKIPESFRWQIEVKGSGSQATSSEAGDNLSQDEITRLEAIGQESQAYFTKLREDWNSGRLSLEQKRQRISEWIEIMHVNNGVFMKRTKGRFDTFDFVTNANGNWYMQGHSTDGEELKMWCDLDSQELDNWFQMVSMGLESNHFSYAPSDSMGSSYKGLSIINQMNDLLRTSEISQDAVFQWQKFIDSDPRYHISGTASSLLHQLRFGISPEALSVYTRINEDIMDQGKALIGHGNELADAYQLSGQVRDEVIAFWSDETRVAQVIEFLNKNNIYAFNSSPLLLFPQEAPIFERIIREYNADFVFETFLNGYKFRSEFGEFASPRVFYEKILPFAAEFSIDRSELVTYMGNCLRSSTPQSWWNQEQRLLWEIVHGEYQISRDSDIPQNTERYIQINPALLPLIENDGQRGAFISSTNLQRFLEEQTSAFSPEKVAVRARELWHGILHLDQTPGNSYFEVVKNAWQAGMREQDLPQERRRIDITDSFIPGKDSSYFSFTVRDYIGMDPREGLFKLIVPGYGEGIHGLHFLTLLKDVDTVEVKTSRGGAIGTILIQKTKGEDGRDILTLAYREDQQGDQPFIGTEVRGWKQVDPTQIQIESALFRNKMGIFGRNIPQQRAEIRLNDEILNEIDVTFVNQTVEGLGTCEIKEGSKRGSLVAIDDIPLTSFDLKTLVEGLPIPELPRGLLSSSGITVNIVNTPLGITRDGTGFLEQQQAVTLISNTISNTYPTILQGMVSSGSLDFDAIFPTELWSDPQYAAVLRSEITPFTQYPEWDNKDAVRRYLLTIPSIKIGDTQYSLAQIISMSRNGELTADMQKAIPSRIVERLKQPIEKQEQRAQPEYNLPLPDDVHAFLTAEIAGAQRAYHLNSPGTGISMYRGALRGMETIAFYSPTDDSFGWHEDQISVVRRAMKGDPNALTLVRGTAYHEAEHQALHTTEEFFSHDDMFHQGVEEGLLQ